MPEPTCGDPGSDEAASYAERAMREAVEAGLTPAELHVLLRGASVAALIPPHPGEGRAAYADRATSELLIRYLSQGIAEPPRSV